MKKRILLILASGVLMFTVLFNTSVLASAEEFVCGAGLHVMTNVSNQTFVTNYDHESPYGTCHVRVEEVKRVEICQCGALKTMETISKKETHSQPH